MGMSGISKSQVSRLCEDMDGKVKAFLNRPFEGDWPYPWNDAITAEAAKTGEVRLSPYLRGRAIRGGTEPLPARLC
jgi:transposase-like protein